jgi:hypothetical protein
VFVSFQNININNNLLKGNNNRAPISDPSSKNCISKVIDSNNNTIHPNPMSKGRSSKASPEVIKTLKNSQSYKPTVRERFRVIYLKLKIVLLFKYILWHIKLVGPNMLNRDIKLEMENIEKLGINTINAPTTSNRLSKGCCNYHYSINPNSKFASFWNFVVLFLLMYTATILPYKTCFFDSSPIFSSDWIFDTVIDCLFFTDLILNFFFAFYDDKEILVTNNKKIALSYLKSWFSLDIISTFPFNYLEVVDTENDIAGKNSVQYNKLLRLAKIPRLYRLARLFRIMRFLRIFKQNKFAQYIIKIFKVNIGIKRIVICLSTLILVSHISACLFYFIAKMEDFGPDTWVSRYKLYDESDGIKYLYSFYFSIITITTVGFGDIRAYTLYEKLFTCFIILFGMVSQIFNIANLALVISKFDNETCSLELKIHSLNKFAKKVRIRDDTYLRIKRVFEEDSNNYISYSETKFIQELPHNIKVEVMFHIHEKQIKRIKYFYDKSPNFVTDLVEKWKKIVFTAKDFIYFDGEVPYDIYFLTKGRTTYYDVEGNMLERFRKGSIMGDIEPFLNVLFI